MNTELPVYSFPEFKEEPIYDLGLFETIFDQAKVKGVVSATPESDEETYQVESQQVRIQTVASRLWLLGYLPEKFKPEEIQSNIRLIRSTVIQFQKDANLKPDYWVGEKTWHALDELVSFESEFTSAKWFAENQLLVKAHEALHRATQLRLWSLGLFPNRPPKEFSALRQEDFSDLKKILLLFSINFDESLIGMNEYTLDLLFNQDVFSIAIGNARYPTRDAFHYNIKAVVNSTSEIDDISKLKELGRVFIVNCARIELWLLGFEVNIGAEVSNRLRTKMTTRKRGSLRKELTKYYLNFEALDENIASAMSKRISPKFFQKIAEANTIVNGDSTDDVTEEIAAKVKSEEEIGRAWNYIKTKGMRLWDGLKRIWRWVKKIGKRVANFIQNNIYKAFFRYVAKAYKIISRGIKNVVDSIKAYVKGGLVLDNMLVEFSKDMDAKAFLQNNASLTDTQNGITKLSQHSKAFNLGCKIIGLIFKIIKELIKGYIGWARLLFALLKSYKKIKPLYQDFKMVASF